MRPGDDPASELARLVVEPHIQVLPGKLQGAELVTPGYAFDHADIIVLLVDHAQFSAIDTDRLQDKVVIDTRGLWSSRRRGQA